MFLAVNAGKRSLAVSLADERGRRSFSASRWGRRLPPEPAAGPRRAARTRRGSRCARATRSSSTAPSAPTGTGPLREEPGYDALMQAAGGLISMTGEPGRPGVRVGSSLIDMGTGMWAALGIVAALLERERTGEGRSSTLALRDGARLRRLPPRRLPRRRHGPAGQGTVFPMVAPYQVLPTRDGELMVAGGTTGCSPRSARSSGCPSWSRTSASGRTPTACGTASSWSRSSRSVSARATRATGTTTFGAQECPAARGGRGGRRRVGADGRARMLQPLPHPAIPDLRLAALPLSFAEDRPRYRSPPPLVGEHTAEVLARGRLLGRGDRGPRRVGSRQARLVALTTMASSDVDQAAWSSMSGRSKRPEPQTEPEPETTQVVPPSRAGPRRVSTSRARAEAPLPIERRPGHRGRGVRRPRQYSASTRCSSGSRQSYSSSPAAPGSCTSSAGSPFPRNRRPARTDCRGRRGRARRAEPSSSGSCSSCWALLPARRALARLPSWQYTWPIALIAVGVAILVRGRR